MSLRMLYESKYVEKMSDVPGKKSLPKDSSDIGIYEQQIAQERTFIILSQSSDLS